MLQDVKLNLYHCLRKANAGSMTHRIVQKLLSRIR